MSGIEHRLRNWGRVVRLYDWEPRGQCHSFEGRYRSPQHWHPEEGKAPPADIRDAWSMESAIQVLRTRSQVLLRIHYVHRMPDAKIRKEIGPSKFPDWGLRTWTDVAAAMIAARHEVEQGLGMPATIRRRRAVEIARRIIGHLDIDKDLALEYRYA